MSAPHPRRGFLRGLATLPLIGGSVALIGKPTAAAIPPSPGMLATYLAWLNYESRWLGHALGIGGMVPHCNPGAYFHHPRDQDWGRLQSEVIGRAPVILAAAGCPFTSPRAEEMWGSTLRTTLAGPRAPGSREELLDQYETWLGLEHAAVAQELGRKNWPGVRLHGPAWDWHGRQREAQSTATRAGVILATVDCEWRRAARF